MEVNCRRMCSFKQIRLSIVVICVITAISADEYKTIETTNGRIRGIRKTTLLKNIPFYSFKSIPYAKPPVGELRFKVNKLMDFESFARIFFATKDKGIQKNEQSLVNSSISRCLIFFLDRLEISILIDAFLGTRAD